MISSGGAWASGRWRVISFVLLAALPIVLLIASIPAGHLLDEAVIDVLVLAAYGAIAGVIIFRRDGHPVGWLLLVLGVTMLLITRLEGFPGVPSAVEGLALSIGWPFLFAQLAALTLIFPSGHLPAGNTRWARIGRAVGRRVLPLFLVMTVLADSPDTERVANPLGFFPPSVWWAGLLGIVLTLLTGAVSLVVRRRHSTGAERAQLGWVVLPLAFLGVAILTALITVLVSELTGAPEPGEGIWTSVYLALLAFPVTFGVAILRYRLYEIDRFISRTVSYGLVTAVLVAVYLGSVFVLGNLLPLQGDLAVAGSTLLAAALFNPLRRRVQGAVDRSFNRSRFDAQVMLDDLSRRLSDEVDLSQLDRELRQVAQHTMQPVTVSVWVR